MTLITLPHELTIYTVCECAPQWREAMHAADALPAEQHHIEVDASGVNEVDGAGVQLLIALHHTASHKGRALVLAQPSAALRRACDRLGAHALLSTTTEEAHA